MFGNKKEDNTTTRAISTSPGAVNILSTGSEFEGKVKTEGDIRIDGRFVGDLVCHAKMIIGPSGNFTGTITCENAVIEGSFSGTLIVKGLLEVKEAGKLNGEIQTGKLIVQSGAIFDVNCSMGAITGSSKPRPKQEVPA
jgi:cytoskeletal protein CcmA (bactofilin family)